MSQVCKSQFSCQKIYYPNDILGKANISKAEINALAVSPESMWGINAHILHLLLMTPINILCYA